MTSSSVSADFLYPSHSLEVDNVKMHYLEQGVGDPILFLHGMPGSSYVWRHVIPHLSTLGRCIALDLVGMGKSEKPDIQYTLFDHIHYVTQFIEKLNLSRLTLVMHGWGSVIGLAYAMQNEKKCKALVLYEAFLQFKGSEIALPFQEQVYELTHSKINDEENGLLLVDKMLSQEMLKPLSEKDLQRYREPFTEKGSAKVLTQYIHELPRAGQSTPVDALIADYSEKLTHSKLPKLLLYSVPGFVMTIATIMWAKDHLPNLEVADLGEELHYAPESNPLLMGESISVWLQGLG